MADAKSGRRRQSALTTSAEIIVAEYSKVPERPTLPPTYSIAGVVILLILGQRILLVLAICEAVPAQRCRRLVRREALDDIVAVAVGTTVAVLQVAADVRRLAVGIVYLASALRD